jgi:4,5-DOPA dioxygenase extradiol
LVDYRRLRPEGKMAHPRDEHFLPLFVAMGAGGGKGRALHRSFAHGSLSMAAFAWG